jgi:hypothetical protein
LRASPPSYGLGLAPYELAFALNAQGASSNTGSLTFFGRGIAGQRLGVLLCGANTDAVRFAA